MHRLNPSEGRTVLKYCENKSPKGKNYHYRITGATGLLIKGRKTAHKRVLTMKKHGGEAKRGRIAHLYKKHSTTEAQRSLTNRGIAPERYGSKKGEGKKGVESKNRRILLVGREGGGASLR